MRKSNNPPLPSELFFDILFALNRCCVYRLKKNSLYFKSLDLTLNSDCSLPSFPYYQDGDGAQEILQFLHFTKRLSIKGANLKPAMISVGVTRNNTLS